MTELHDFFEYCRHVDDLRNFTVLNYIGVLKILKKYDKKTGTTATDISRARPRLVRTAAPVQPGLGWVRAHWALPTRRRPAQAQVGAALDAGAVLHVHRVGLPVHRSPGRSPWPWRLPGRHASGLIRSTGSMARAGRSDRDPAVPVRPADLAGQAGCALPTRLQLPHLVRATRAEPGHGANACAHFVKSAQGARSRPRTRRSPACGPNLPATRSCRIPSCCRAPTGSVAPAWRTWSTASTAPRGTSASDVRPPRAPRHRRLIPGCVCAQRARTGRAGPGAPSARRRSTRWIPAVTTWTTSCPNSCPPTFAARLAGPLRRTPSTCC